MRARHHPAYLASKIADCACGDEAACRIVQDIKAAEHLQPVDEPTLRGLLTEVATVLVGAAVVMVLAFAWVS